MIPIVSPYRLTPEDLAGLDSKTRSNLSPLLDALNTTLPQLVAASQAVSEQYVDVPLVVGATVAASFPLLFRAAAIARPLAVLLANLRPRDVNHVLTAPFVVQGWSLTDNGLVSVPWITGLLVNNTYDVTFLVKG